MAQPLAEAPPFYHPGPWTVDEVLALPEDGNRHELFGGRLVVSPLPSRPHQIANKRFLGIIDDQVPKEWEAIPEVDLRVGPHLLIPDVLVGRSDVLAMSESPTVDPREVVMVLEILRPGNTQFERAWKTQRYAEAGIPFYLEAELEGAGSPRITVFKLIGTGYVKVAVASAGEKLELAEPFKLSFDPAELVGVRR